MKRCRVDRNGSLMEEEGWAETTVVELRHQWWDRNGGSRHNYLAWRLCPRVWCPFACPLSTQQRWTGQRPSYKAGVAQSNHDSRVMHRSGFLLGQLQSLLQRHPIGHCSDASQPSGSYIFVHVRTGGDRFLVLSEVNECSTCLHSSCSGSLSPGVRWAYLGANLGTSSHII